MVKEELGIQKEGGVGKYLGLPEQFGRKKEGSLYFHCGQNKTKRELLVKLVSVQSREDDDDQECPFTDTITLHAMFQTACLPVQEDSICSHKVLVG